MSSINNAKQISFPKPLLLASDRPSSRDDSLWVYFPPTGTQGLMYQNAVSGWWVKFNSVRDIKDVKGLNGQLVVTFHPGRAFVRSYGLNNTVVNFSTGYPTNVHDGYVTITVPYTNVVVPPQ